MIQLKHSCHEQIIKSHKGNIQGDSPIMITAIFFSINNETILILIFGVFKYTSKTFILYS